MTKNRHRKELLKVCPLVEKQQTRRERPKSAPNLRLKNIQGPTNGNIWKELFFSKKRVFLKVAQCRKLKRGHLGSLNVFTNQKLQKNARWYPLIEFKNSKIFEKKLHSAEKKPKGGPFDLASTFGSIKKFVV